MESYFATVDLLKSSSDFLNIFAASEDGEKQIVPYVNTLLSTAKTRHKGLSLLTESLPSLSSDRISEYVFTWLKYCIVLHDRDALRETRLIALSKIITCAHSKHDFDKTFISGYLPKVLEMCLASNLNDNHTRAALECLTVCLITYPNWFNPHLRRIENFLLKFFDATSEDVMKKSAMAFLYLQQSGGGGLNKINYINNFATSFTRLIHTATDLLTDMMDVTEIETTKKASLLPPYNLLPIKALESSVDIYYRTSQRLINIVTCLKTMIQRKFAAPKSIKPKALLDFIDKGMSIHICVSSGGVPNEDWHKADCVKKFQIHLLYLLQSFLLWLRTNALPFSYTITKVLVDGLVRSDKCKCFRVNKLYQEVLHRTLLEWINITKSIHSSFQAKVFCTLLHNIMPIGDKVELNLDITLSKGKSKKLKRKAVEERTITFSKLASQKSVPQFIIILENNAQIALKTVKSLLTVMTVGIDKNVLEQIYKVVIDVALTLQTGHCPDPYNNIQCQIELYEVLTAFLEQDRYSYLISVHPICRILNDGVKNTNRRISATCENGLRKVEKLSQPICPYLAPIFSEKVSEEDMSLPSDDDNVLENEDQEDVCYSPYSPSLSPLIPIESQTDKNDNKKDNSDIDITEKRSKNIKIVDVQIIKPATNGDVSQPKTSAETEVNGRDSSHNIPMQIDDDDDDGVDECLETIQIDDSEGEVEFVKEQIIIADEKEDDKSNENICKVDEEEKVIETVNKLTVLENGALVEECVKETKTFSEVNETKTDDIDDIEMCNDFVDEVADF